MRMMQRSDEECFGKLPIYFHNLKLHNPGTVTYIETDSENRFECCFFAIGAAVSKLSICYFKNLTVLSNLDVNM